MYINKYFRPWVEKGAINCHHMLLLLEAEALSFECKSADQTRRAYDKAISAAAKIGSLSMRALGNERVGVFFRENGDLLRSKAYLTKARDLYCEWGAMEKVDDMNRRFKECSEEGAEIATIHLRGTTTSSGGGVLRARSRLDDLCPLSTSQHKVHVLDALVGQTT